MIARRLTQSVGRGCFAALLLLLCIAPFAAAQATAAAGATTVLQAGEAGKLMPATVFFKGQSAPVQARNSGGIRTADGSYMLTALVDNSGYSSQVQERYQAYLITEIALQIDGHRLEPGSYGIGFVANDTFAVMDIGGHDLFTAHTAKNATLRRPVPLQVVTADAGSYRLYSGRTFVTFSIANAGGR